MEIKAKTVSLWSKIGSVALIVLGTALVGLRVLPGITTADVIMSALAIAGIFGTIDINLMLEKITGRKTGV
jgi:hypothetical protein